jgi:ATP-dependent Lon protease
MIVLDDCYHFPGCHLPLFILEERYRLMLDHALRSDRMFCVGVRSGRGEEVLPVVTAGLIRASVKNPDGTSQVVLSGVERMRVTGWEQTEPFRIAKVRCFESEGAPPENLKMLKARALELLPVPTNDSCDAIHQLRTALEVMEEPELVCDIIAFHFVRRKSALRAILEDPCPQRRYERLVADLEKAKP